MGRTGSGVEVRASSIRITWTEPDGTPRRETLTVNGRPMAPTPANIKHAHRIAAEVKDKARHGVLVLSDYFPDSKHAGPGLSVAAQLTTWLSSLRVEASTRKGYESAKRFWVDTLGAKDIRRLKHSDILAALATRPLLSGKTVNNYVSALREACQLAVLDKVIPANPVAAIPSAKHQKAQPDPFTRDEAEAIIADMAKHYPPEVAAYVEAKFFTGLRTGEIAALKWPNVDIPGAHAVIAASIVNGVEKASTKTATARAVRLNSRALAAIQAQKARTYLAGEYVFLDPRRAAPWSKEQFFTRWYWLPTLKRLSMRYRPPYNTRHTYATIMLMAGMTPAFCAGQMGHDIKVFLSTYARWLPGAADDAEMARLEGALSAPILTRKA